MLQWDKNVITKQQSVTPQVTLKNSILPADGNLSSVKDGTPKKSRSTAVTITLVCCIQSYQHRKITHQNCLTNLESVLDKVKVIHC